VPGDISSSAFFLVAASIAEGSELVLEHVGINPTRTGVIDILRLMGADITLENQREVGGEPVADLRVRAAKLKGIEIPEALVPLAIDEFPVLFVAAACAEGRTVLRGAEELRVKESDRIQVMADGLLALGVKCEPTPDGIIIDGGQIGGGEVHGHGDHRIAMAFSVASLRASAPIRIHDCANVATSFPNFLALCAGRHPCCPRGSVVNCTGHHHRRAKRLGQGHGRRDPGQAPGLESAGFRRAVPPAGIRCANHGVDLTNEELLKKLALIWMCSSSRRPKVSCSASFSKVTKSAMSSVPKGRFRCLPGGCAAGGARALLQRQRAFQEAPGLVADGRDMGTVVFPDAPLKIFLTASAEERARRRYLQLKGKVDGVSLSSLLDEIRARDERDTQRAVAPLKPAADAIQLDSTELSIEQVLERIMSEIAIRDIAG
jgi:hypothetical protein